MTRRDDTRWLIDHAIPWMFLGGTIAGTYVLLEQGVPHYLVATFVVSPFAVAAAILERVRPEREDYRKLDQPFVVDAAHFFLNYLFGYGLAVVACAGIAHGLQVYGMKSFWPDNWPLALQIVLAGFLAEIVSYWQHRLVHRVPWLWRFHALHHSGGRLNLMRTGRFHFVDIGLAGLTAFLPLVVLGAPDTMLTWVAAIGSMIGILTHANMRMRTPVWLGWLISTPALHRHHHSLTFEESDRNFATLVVLFDILFGTYEQPRPDGPPAVGIANDPVPRGFWNQFIAPFRRA